MLLLLEIILLHCEKKNVKTRPVCGTSGHSSTQEPITPVLCCVKKNEHGANSCNRRVSYETGPAVCHFCPISISVGARRSIRQFHFHPDQTIYHLYELYPAGLTSPFSFYLHNSFYLHMRS